MREIKFKAKCIDTGEWVEGFFWKHSIRGNQVFVIGSTRASSLDIIEIDPETLCQFTGLKDKNGKEIFEGDIDKEGFVFEYNVNMGGWFRMKNHEGFGWHEQAVKQGKLPFEVIGNIHDQKGEEK